MTRLKRLKSTPKDENAPPRPVVAVCSNRKSVVRGKRGILRKLKELPEDIEDEIFSHLDTESLLNLARSCESLWEKYTAPRKSQFWVRCRQRCGLPDCPPHLTEHAFARLLYTKRCHLCSKRWVYKIIWEASARYCDACINVQMVGIRAFFEDPANEAIKIFESLLPTVKVNDRLSFHRPYLLALVRTWNRTNNVAWEEFEAGEREHLQVFSAHVEACKQWKKVTDAAREKERKSLHDQRYSFIRAKLLAAGYDEDLLAFADSKLRQLKQVHGKVYLDNKGWDKIRFQMNEFMNSMQASQAFVERIHRFVRYFGQLKEEHLHDEDIVYWPGTVDLLLMQGASCRTRVTNGSMESEIDLPALKAEILGDVSRWLLEKKAELEDLIRSSKPDFYPEDVQAVDLAACVLRCFGCHDTVRFPEVLVHRCFRGYDSSGRSWAMYKELQLRDDLFDQTVIETLGYCPWSAGEDMARHLRLSKNEPRVNTMYTLCGLPPHGTLMEKIEKCGKDPLRVTWKEMDECNPVFSHSALNTGVTVMSWRYATMESWTLGDSWKVNDPELSPDARIAVTKDVRLAEQGVRESRVFCCARCTDPFLTRMAYAEAVDHVRTSHAKEGACIEGGDIYCHPDNWAMWASLKVFK